MAAGASFCILLLGLLATSPAQGQFSGSHVPEKIVHGEPANLFATWAGGPSIDGFAIHLPPDWHLEGASVLKNSFVQLPFTIRSTGSQRYDLLLERPLSSPAEIILNATPGPGLGTERITIVPFGLSGAIGRRIELDGDRLSLSVHHDGAFVDPENRVLAFTQPEAEPLVFRRDAVPRLDLDRAFVASFWMKTTGLNEVVLSTWNGADDQSYPLEIIVDASGRLRCFHGQPGEHRSMGSKIPLADGIWHRVTVTNEPGGGWMRLQVDGRTADSLFSASPVRIPMRLPLAIGGRVPADEAYFDKMKPFSGYVDAIRIEHVGSSTADPLELDLDRRIPEDLLSGEAAGVRLVRSDLTFRRPIADFRATQEDGGVTIQWRSRDAQSREFIVERSRDGHLFEEVHRVRAGSRSRDYEYLDHNAAVGVVYYRVRQVFGGGAERISGTIKVGMGEELPERVTLVGNFPNPFNAATTISYVVKEQTHVKLSVWDVSGQPVRQLVDRTVAPGFYEVQFDAGDLPSGTYFIRLHSRSSAESHKMILMK